MLLSVGSIGRIPADIVSCGYYWYVTGMSKEYLGDIVSYPHANFLYDGDSHQTVGQHTQKSNEKERNDVGGEEKTNMETVSFFTWLIRKEADLLRTWI